MSDTINEAAHLAMKPCPGCGVMLLTLADATPGRCTDCRQVDPELWESAVLKVHQLESEIRRSTATQAEKSNMLHTLSKLWMFATDATPKRSGAR